MPIWWSRLHHPRLGMSCEEARMAGSHQRFAGSRQRLPQDKGAVVVRSAEDSSGRSGRLVMRSSLRHDAELIFGQVVPPPIPRMRSDQGSESRDAVAASAVEQGVTPSTDR